MSSIYIQEPPTNGKVLLVTTVGDIDVELWSKEAPKACRNFVQLCLEGYYNGTVFHRLVHDFIVQGGDPTGSGEGGESIWGKPFKDEFHSRLRFTRRGLMAMANAGPNDNGSQFFFSLGPAPELNNKHTIFGKVAGNTVYNMIKLADCEIGENERPVYPHKILKAKILANPFDDIVPRNFAKKEQSETGIKRKKSTAKATKNFNLLSFGEEAEEDEEEVNKATKSMRGRSKSSHDLLDDEKLSAVPAVGNRKRRRSENDEDGDEGEEENEEEEEGEKEEEGLPEDDASTWQRNLDDAGEKDDVRDSVKRKLNDGRKSGEGSGGNDIREKSADFEDEKTQRLTDLKRQAADLKREIVKSRKGTDDDPDKDDSKDADPVEHNSMIASYKSDQLKYMNTKKTQLKKGSGRESQTLQMLEKFKSKLNSAKLLQEYSDDEKDSEDGEEGDAPDAKEGDITWLGHKLKFDTASTTVMDANIDDVNRYEIFDPRNPMNKRRREASKQTMKGKR